MFETSKKNNTDNYFLNLPIVAEKNFIRPSHVVLGRGSLSFVKRPRLNTVKNVIDDIYIYFIYKQNLKAELSTNTYFLPKNQVSKHYDKEYSRISATNNMMQLLDSVKA